MFQKKKQSLDCFKTYSNSGTWRRKVFVKNRSETFDIDRHKPIWTDGLLISGPGFLNWNCSTGFHRSWIWTNLERNIVREMIIMFIKKHGSTIVRFEIVIVKIYKRRCEQLTLKSDRGFKWEIKTESNVSVVFPVMLCFTMTKGYKGLFGWRQKGERLWGMSKLKERREAFYFFFMWRLLVNGMVLLFYLCISQS